MPKILVAEDNPLNIINYEFILQDIDCRATTVHTGSEVLEALDQGNFDLILMDIRMPEMDGVEATKRIRQSGCSYKNIPIIAVTAHAKEQDREEYLAAGMDDCIEKPVSLPDLLRVMVRYLGRV